MDPSGPTSLADLDADLALSEDDEAVDMPQDPWPPLSPSLQHGRKAALTSRQSAPCKRPNDSASDTGSEASSPAHKSVRRKHSPVSHQGTQGTTMEINYNHSPPIPSTNSNTHLTDPNIAPPQPSQPTAPAPPQPSQPIVSALPAFAPRTDYVKLTFKNNPEVNIKLRWLAEVNQAFRLDRDLAEVKMSAVTSRFVYVSRRRQDIIDSITKGEFLALFLEIQDSPERPRKFPTYLLTRYPVCADPSLAKELPGIYSVRRFYQDGSPINRLVITWSLPEAPPPTVTFSFLPSLPSCEFRKFEDAPPLCYRCWGSGHISRYCSAAVKCAWCSEAHDSRTCIHANPTSAAASTSSTR